MSRRCTLNQQIIDCQALLQTTRLMRRQNRQSGAGAWQPALILLTGFAGGFWLQRLKACDVKPCDVKNWDVKLSDVAKAAGVLFNAPQQSPWWYQLGLALLQRLTPGPADNPAPAAAASGTDLQPSALQPSAVR